MRYVDDKRDAEYDRDYEPEIRRVSEDVEAGDYAVASAYPVGDAYRAYQILHIAFVILPIIAGLDKFFHYIVNWDQYLSPQVSQLAGNFGFSGHYFMLIVGVVEIVAGLLVAFLPRIGGWVVALWLWGIIINLILLGGYYDVALRDFGLSLGAIALSVLSPERHIVRRRRVA